MSVLSHSRCIAAKDAGKFKDEIVPMDEFAIMRRAAMSEANQVTIVSRW